MMGTSDDQAELQVKGQALVTFRSACDAVLQLKQASITGLDEKVSCYLYIFTFVFPYSLHRLGFSTKPT